MATVIARYLVWHPKAIFYHPKFSQDGHATISAEVAITVNAVRSEFDYPDASFTNAVKSSIIAMYYIYLPFFKNEESDKSM